MSVEVLEEVPKTLEYRTGRSPLFWLPELAWKQAPTGHRYKSSSFLLKMLALFSTLLNSFFCGLSWALLSSLLSSILSSLLSSLLSSILSSHLSLLWRSLWISCLSFLLSSLLRSLLSSLLSRLAISLDEGPRQPLYRCRSGLWPHLTRHTPHLTHFKLPLDPASRPRVRPTIKSSISSVLHKVHSWFHWFFAVKSIDYHQLVVYCQALVQILVPTGPQVK